MGGTSATHKPHGNRMLLTASTSCIIETDAAANFRIYSLFADQGVDLWINGTTVKTRPGSGDLRVVAPPGSRSYGLRN